MDTGFSDLILLIGTNPMPPYVVGRYFLTQKQAYPQLKTLWLLYSEAKVHQASTEPLAENLKKVFQRYFDVEIRLYPIRDISNARSIQEDIQNLVLALDSDQIHLNYSGGTKAMVIHAYRTLEQSIIKERSFSYLDGRRFQIISDQTGNPLHDQDLRSLVDLDFQDFITLHGFELYSPLKLDVSPDFIAPLAVLKTMIAQRQLENFWGLKHPHQGWLGIRQELMRALHGVFDVENPKYLKKFKKQLAKLLPVFNARVQNFVPHPQFEKLLSSFGPAYPFFYAQTPLELNSDQDYIRLFQLMRFLDGAWLEMYIFQAFAEVLRELHYPGHLAMGLELKKAGWSTYFEIDLAALIGYQLVGISCTTYDAKSACKNKGFEILHRTRQIGGDEIREILKMLLVTYVDQEQKKRLQQELLVDTGSSRANILVLGREDWCYEDLKTQIKAFISYH